MTLRVAIGGFQHETNTFAPVKADYAAFEQADSWPGLSRGEALFGAVAGMNLPIAGFVAAAGDLDLVPVLWCAATPSAQVTEDAFERVAGELIEGIRIAKPDAVYLDLHGAMVAEHTEDGEGLLLARLRAEVGDIPIVVSLDLHANVTEAMMASGAAFVAYRTYPHIDMDETGARVADLLRKIVASGQMRSHMRKLDFLIPLTSQCTLVAPARNLYDNLSADLGDDLWSLSFAMGFPPADIAECGPAVFGFGADQAAVTRAVDALADEISARERAFDQPLLPPGDAVSRAMANDKPGPVVIADTQDNPGAGGNSDTIGMLHALAQGGAKGAVMAIVYDPPSADQAHALGEGGVADFALGAVSGAPGHTPYPGRFLVEKINDGKFTGTGPVWRGANMDLGPMALLRLQGQGATDIRVVVASRKFQAGDQALFRHLGVEPAEQRILVLKSSVHFRADFQPIAADVLVAVSPGPNLADPALFPYKKLRAGIRLSPNGPEFG